MSRPHDGQKNFFPFGNPFRMIFSKGSYLSTKHLALLNAFDRSLIERLKKLKPNSRNDVLSLSWMRLAMDLLSETHDDIKTLITDLEFPVTEWDEKWMDVYLDSSIKLLDICIAFTSHLSRLNQGQLLLQYVLHVMDATMDTPSSEQLAKARSSLDDWMQQIGSNNSKVENCCAILNGLSESLHLPKVKSSAKGKVLMHAMYGVKVMTIFVCSAFVAAFLGSTKAPMDLNVPEKFFWAESFSDLQADVNGEIRSLLSNGSSMVVKELEAVTAIVKNLLPMISDDGVGSAATEELHDLILDLGKNSERLSQGLDLLSNGVESFFQIVLSGRDALLCNLRVCSTNSDLKPNGAVEEHVVP